MTTRPKCSTPEAEALADWYVRELAAVHDELDGIRAQCDRERRELRVLIEELTRLMGNIVQNPFNDVVRLQ